MNFHKYYIGIKCVQKHPVRIYISNCIYIYELCTLVQHKNGKEVAIWKMVILTIFAMELQTATPEIERST